MLLLVAETEPVNSKPEGVGARARESGHSLIEWVVAFSMAGSEFS
jgi:hypothetical protein